jgi:hypothetical protein
MGDTSICGTGPPSGQDAGQALLACARQLGAKVSCEAVTGITSLTARQASPAGLLGHNRDHWGIENGLHHRRSPGVPSLSHDVTPEGPQRASATPSRGVVLVVAAGLTLAVSGRGAWCNTCGVTTGC